MNLIRLHLIRHLKRVHIQNSKWEIYGFPKLIVHFLSDMPFMQAEIIKGASKIVTKFLGRLVVMLQFVKLDLVL